MSDPVHVRMEIWVEGCVWEQMISRKTRQVIADPALFQIGQGQTVDLGKAKQISTGAFMPAWCWPYEEFRAW